MRSRSVKMRKFQWIFGLLILIFATACAPNIERLKKKGDVDKLIEVIEGDSNPYTMTREMYDAAIALGELGDKKAIKPLIGSLRDDAGLRINNVSYNDVVKESLILLGENNPEEIIDYLNESGVYTGDSKRADAIKEVLIEIGPILVDPFLDAVKENTRLEDYALEIFSEFGSSIMPILEEAHNNDPESLFIREALNDASGYRYVTNAAEAVCRGRTIPYAADYDPSMQGNRGVYIVGIEIKYNNDVWEEYSNDLADKTHLLQVVMCFDEEAVLIETCGYLGPNIERYQNKYNVSIVCAKTGEILAEKTFTSEPPRECKQTEHFDVKVLKGAFDYSQIVEWLRQFVEP